MDKTCRDELIDNLAKMEPDENGPKVERGNSTFYGMELIDGKLACSKCNTIEPPANAVMHADGKEFFSWTFQCKCGHYITQQTKRSKNDPMRHAPL